MKGKKDIFIATFNVQTLQKERKIPELIASADSTKHDIICIQEHRLIRNLQQKNRSLAAGNWSPALHGRILWMRPLEEPEYYLAHKPTMLLPVLKW